VNAVRLRSLNSTINLNAILPVVIDRLGGMNKLRIVNPLRLEIETQFLTADQLQPGSHQADPAFEQPGHHGL
jgi:lysine 2,3-aminomutase